MDQDELSRLHAENAALRSRVHELEQTLRASQNAAAFLESVLAAVPAFIVNLDPDLKVRFLNRYQTGHSPETTAGISIFEFISPEQRAVVSAQIEQARNTGELTSLELHDAAGPDGEPASYALRIAPVREAGGRAGVCLVALDVTEHERREQTLHETQQALQVALAATGFGVWCWDLRKDETVWDCNMRALHGREEPVPLHRYLEIVHPDDRARLQANSERLTVTGIFSEVPYRVIRPDGSMRWLVCAGRPLRDEQGKIIKMVGGCLDVTRTRELEEQLRQSQKMEAIGSLTAGIAHNFNNMLAVILPTLEMVQRRAPPEYERMLGCASHAAQRAAELVRELMTYAGQNAAEGVIVCNLDSIVQAAVDICRRTFDAHISLERVTELPRAHVRCSPVQIEQVLVNLLVNARDAILDSGAERGRVEVRVRATDLPSADGSVQEAVSIEVIDNGLGMTDSVRSRVFEPFFTTKGLGKGTGLGLATSYAIARDHQGTLTCCSTPGRGATFTLSLPLSAQPEAVPAAPAPSRLPQGVRVLVVDDEPHVRHTLAQVLADAGLLAALVRDGEAALEYLKQTPDVQVVLLDRSLPGGAGEHFVGRMRALCPDARIAFVSGQATPAEIATLVDAVLPKPLTGTGLLRGIQDLLEQDLAR